MAVLHKKRFAVLASDKVDEAGLSILRSVADVDMKVKLSEDQLVGIIPNYDALIVRSGTTVTRRIIEAGKRLQIIGRAGVGVDNVDVKAATEQGIFVVNSPHGNVIAAAEHTLGLIFSLARHVPQADASIRQGRWDRTFIGTQLQNKTLGIVGLGKVGAHVAKVANEMGMKLIAYDPYVNEQRGKAMHCEMVTVDELCGRSDFITLHVPLMPETKHLIDERRLCLMKPTTRIINASRGGVVDEKALCKALQEKKIAGAALDVFEVEKAFPPESPLLNAPNLVLTPHLGASTAEAQVNVAVDVAHQIHETLCGNLPQSAVNLPGMNPSELQGMKPLLDCCRTVGRVAARMLQGALESITVTMEGEFAKEKEDCVLLAVASEAISTHLASRVNFINVKQIAEDHHIRLLCTKDPSVLPSGIKVQVASKTHRVSVGGSPTAEGDVLVRCFHDIPVYLLVPNGGDGKSTLMFYSKHADQPNALAQVTTTLGNAGVNIANCYLGRKKDEATGEVVGLALFQVDGEVEPKVVSAVAALPQVRECQFVEL